MKRAIKDLLVKEGRSRDWLHKLLTAEDAVKDVSVLGEPAKVFLTSLIEQIRETRRFLYGYQQELITLRKSCDHNWIYDGHGHRDSYYICSICKDEKRE